MAASIQTVAGVETVVITEGKNITEIALPTLGAYAELLGEPDPVKALDLARAARQLPPDTDWSEVYAHLGQGLKQMVLAGVPAEFRPDLLEDATGSPVPDRSAVKAAQAKLRGAISRAGGMRPESAGPLSAMLAAKSDAFRAARVAFLDELSPKVDPKPNDSASPLMEGRPEIRATVPSADNINARPL